MRSVIEDVRLALRKLRARPVLAVTAIATLALGIGAPTATFSVVRSVLIRPLPYPDPDRIVRFQMRDRDMTFDAIPVEMVADWSATSQTLASIALFSDRALTLSTTTGPYRLEGAAATPNLFSQSRPAALVVSGTYFACLGLLPLAIVLVPITWVQPRYLPAGVGSSVRIFFRIRAQPSFMLLAGPDILKSST